MRSDWFVVLCEDQLPKNTKEGGSKMSGVLHAFLVLIVVALIGCLPILIYEIATKGIKGAVEVIKMALGLAIWMAVFIVLMRLSGCSHLLGSDDSDCHTEYDAKGAYRDCN